MARGAARRNPSASCHPANAIPDEVRYRASAGQDRCFGVARALRARGGMMPVRKFRSVEEMTPLPDRRPFDPENLRMAIAWSRVALALHPTKRAPGVHKYHSYEEMKTRDDLPRVTTSPAS